MKEKILKQFYDIQCNEDTGDFNDEETPLVTYKNLEKKTGMSRARLKVEIIEMRNEQILELCPAVDQDYIPSGSGYLLTEKGQKLVKELFFNPLPPQDKEEKI